MNRTKKRKLKINFSGENKLKLKPEIINSMPRLKIISKPDIKADVINILEELELIYNSQKEHYRAMAFKKALSSLMYNFNDKKIEDISELENINGFGTGILNKLKEYFETGHIVEIDNYKKSPQYIFSQIYGVGPKKAIELVDRGMATIDDLKSNINNPILKLNDKQKIGIRYYEPLLERIPREEILLYKQLFTNIFKSISNDNSSDSFEIVGSFRRGANNSGDIDVIVTGETSGKFNQFLDILTEQNIIVEVLSRGDCKSLTIGKLNNHSVPRRIDFLFSPLNEYSFAILYFTGSKYFNTAMRNHALQKNYTLNEHGIYNIKNVTGHKFVKGDRVAFPFIQEQDIFEFLQLEYVEPNKRKDSNSLIHMPEPKLQIQSTPVKPAIPVKLKIKKELFIEQFRKRGRSYLDELSLKKLNLIIKKANDIYTNNPEKQILTDSEYDMIKDYIVNKYGKTKETLEIGAPVISRNKITLPYPMPSMDKIKADAAELENWKNKYTGPYIISGKADGVSVLYSTENETPTLFTRGNGTVGQNISYLIPFLKLPKANNSNIKFTIRGELIMKKSVFNEKYRDKFANPRNLVAGIINSQTTEIERYRDLDCLIYEVLHPNELKPIEQLTTFLQNNCTIESITNIIRYDIINEWSALTTDVLSEKLSEWRASYDYEIDGLIVANNQTHERKCENPKHAFAFKMILTEQIAETTVVNVIWTPSKDGYLKPRIEIAPVYIGGVEITHATAFNAGFVRDNKLGVGSVIKIIRSGDVIPHILEVITPAVQLNMPSLPYSWTDTNVDIILNDKDMNTIVKCKQIVGFFKKIGVENFGEGNVNRIIRHCISDQNTTLPKNVTVKSILNMEIDDYLKIPGFKITMASKLYNNIKKCIAETTLVKLIVATNIMGRGMGEKRIAQILDNSPDIITNNELSNQDKIDIVSGIHGMAVKSATLFVSNIDKIYQFLLDTNLQDKLKIEKESEIDLEQYPLYNKKIVMTGFRDKLLTQKIIDLRGVVDNAVTKSTYCVIVNNIIDETEKTKTAKRHNIEIIDIENFKNRFQIIC